MRQKTPDVAWTMPEGEGPGPDGTPGDPRPDAQEPATPAPRKRRVFGWLATFLFAVLFLAAVAGGILWATDYEVKADVEETRCDVSQVTVRTRQFGVVHTVDDVPLTQCLLVEPGDYVEYRIRTQRTTLYDANGDCVYDSIQGPC